MSPPLLESLRLQDFRCFASLEFTPGPSRTFLVGRNAQGKTSILEAVCLLLRLQSPRTSTLAELVRFGTPGFAVDGRCAGSHLQCRWQDGQRSLVLDGKAQSRSTDYLDVCRVAWFANTDLELVRGSGSTRRRFLDFLGSQAIPGYRAHLRAYEKALRSRNALLKDNRPRREVAAFDEPLCENGDALLAARDALCSALAPVAAHACEEISGSADRLRITYRPGSTSPMAEGLAAARSNEDRLRQTTVGPHRDDLVLHLNDLDASAFASEGQQRSIALALKMAQARHLQNRQGTPPLFLIDDVFGELDTARRNRLLQAIPVEAQALITTTFLEWAEELSSATIFELADTRLNRPIPPVKHESRNQ